MDKEEKFFRQGSIVWTITRKPMTLDQLARSGLLDDEDDDSGVTYKEKEFDERFVKGAFVNGVYDFFKDHFSPIETTILLNRIVDEIVEDWANMSYGEDARPAMEKLKKFVDNELAKTEEQKELAREKKFSTKFPSVK